MVCPYVGGGFGSKGKPHANVVLAAMAARALPGRPVKLALTRQQMFFLAGYRTPTIQRMQLAADRDGRLQAIAHRRGRADLEGQGVRGADRHAHPDDVRRAEPAHHAPAGRAGRRRALVDAGAGRVPGHVRPRGGAGRARRGAAGSTRWSCASATSPRSTRDRKPWSSRHLVECLREGARAVRLGRPRPAARRRRDGGWLVGTGVAASVYPTMRQAKSTATVRFEGRPLHRRDRRRGPRHRGLDGAPADHRRRPRCPGRRRRGPDRRHRGTRSRRWPGARRAPARGARRSSRPRRAFRDKFGGDPSRRRRGVRGRRPGGTDEEHAAYAFGAQFAEARVNVDTGEIRVPRLLGVFARAGSSTRAPPARSSSAA